MSTDEQMLEELREIRKLLSPSPPPQPPDNFVDEFVTFLKKYKVLGLAVAFILAIYLGNVVSALVDYIVMPVVELVLPEVDWQAISIGPFGVGAFAGEVVTFIIIAFVAFVLVKVAARIGIE